MAVEISFFMLLMVASAVALVAKRARLPYTVALVITGLVLGAADPHTEWLDLERVHLTPELLFNVFLPLLLFEAAFHLSWPKFKENLRAILLLAAPGVAAAVGLGGLFSFWLEPLVGPGLPLMVAFLLSSVLAATDPVSVIALFKELGVPKRLAVVMEGESLLNDAVGVVAFTVVGALLGLGHASEAVTPLWVARFLLWEIGVGLLAGAGVGLAVSWATTLVDDHLIEIMLTTTLVDDHLIEIMLTTVAAFGSYLVATALHASPVLAVVAAGMACGNVGARYGMTPTNRIAVESFWEYAVFVANGFVFLLVGREIDLGRMIAHGPEILLAWLSLTVARAIVIAIVERTLSRTREKIPARWAAVLTWGGLRGSLSMVLALSLPASFEHRGLVVDLTFGVVLLSILVQGPTMVPVLRWAGALAGGDAHTEYDKLRTGLRAVRAALRRLDEQRAAEAIHESTFDAMRARLGGREAELEERLSRLGALEDARSAELERIERELLDVEHAVIREATERGVLDAQGAASLLEGLRAPSPAHEETNAAPPAHASTPAQSAAAPARSAQPTPDDEPPVTPER